MYEEGFSIGAATVILESGGQNLVKNGINTRNTHLHREREREREREVLGLDEVALDLFGLFSYVRRSILFIV